jgi:hypothetical protein
MICCVVFKTEELMATCHDDDDDDDLTGVNVNSSSPSREYQV